MRFLLNKWFPPLIIVLLVSPLLGQEQESKSDLPPGPAEAATKQHNAGEKEQPLSSEDPIGKEMQAIEPGFDAKDERARQLFMLHKLIKDNEEVIKAKRDKALQIRNLFSQNFRDELNLYTQRKIGSREKKYDKAMAEVVRSFEHALKYNPRHPKYGADSRYYLGVYAFELDEKEYFGKLAEYNEQIEKGNQDVEYPEENFSRTINLFEDFIVEYPNHPQISEAYYLLAMASAHSTNHRRAGGGQDESVQIPQDSS